MEKELIEKYSPFNAKNLTADELKAMQDFTVDDLKQLSEAYPNKGNQKAYLILFDKGKPENKQVFPLSTWTNLYQLFRLGNKQYTAYSFKSIFNRQKQAVKKVAPVQDLTNQQAKEELKTAQSQTAKAVKPVKTAVPVAAGQTAVKKEATGVVTPKSFKKMNVEELGAAYKTAFKKDPGTMSKKDLVTALEAKKK